MSTATGTPPRALFAGLIDDAAVFPPGSFPLPEAVSRRAARRPESYVDLVGPLLLPPALAVQALDETTPLTVAVVGRPDVPLSEVVEAARQVVDSEGHSLAGIEIGYRPDWRDALVLGVPLAVEITPDQADGTAMDDLARDRLDQVRAKLRTGSTPKNPVPAPDDLARFIAAAVDHELAFKLTGGMHRAVSHRAATPDGGEDQFGFLNVIIAVDELLRGSTADAAASLLSQRDHGAVAALVADLDRDRADAVRNTFHSYGCCDVLDPIRDLSDLDLIEETP